MKSYLKKIISGVVAMITLFSLFGCSSNQIDEESRNAHTQNIQAKVQSHYNSIENNICPKCGGTLVERNGKYGTFLGCSNYPKCRFTYNN